MFNVKKIFTTFLFCSSLSQLFGMEDDKESKKFNVAILHIEPKLGDIAENLKLLEQLSCDAFKNGAQIVLAPESSVTGYSITKDQVLNENFGFKKPFEELNRLKEIASHNKGYIVLGISEIDGDNEAYNSAILLEPNGEYKIQRKRGVCVWNKRGQDDFNVFPTPYGNLGIVICSDTYLMDWCRILALKGAEIILSPANWWGSGCDALNVWSSRAVENAVFMIIANRFGKEIDKRFTPHYTYDMNDAVSAIIDPLGKEILNYSSKSSCDYQNKVLISPIVNNHNKQNKWLILYREPSAYLGIANEFYRPDLNNKQADGLPDPKIIDIGVITYIPSSEFEKNMSLISKFVTGSTPLSVLLIPALGLQSDVLDTANSNWNKYSPWKEAQDFIEKLDINILVTSVKEKRDVGVIDSLLVLKNKSLPIIRSSIHTFPSSSARSFVQEPLHIDIDGARVGVVFGKDALFPEISTSLSKNGVDAIFVPSDLKENDIQLKSNWRVMSNNCVSVIMSSSCGFGTIIKNGGGYIEEAIELNANSYSVQKLDVTKVRNKYLNAYRKNDILALIK